MARGVNKVILVGTCGQDPEVRYLPNGNAVTNLSLATSEQWTDKQTGQKVEKTEWDTSKPDGTPQKLLDVSKLADAGWTAKISLEEGMERTVAWFRDNIDNIRE